MPRAVRFDRYGDVDELYVADVPTPEAEPGRVVVRVIAAGLNPGEIAVREGAFEERWPTTFPSGQGSDFAGVVEATGPDVTDVVIGDAVLGWSDERGAQADLVSVPADHVTAMPADLPWEAAGSLAVAGFTALSLRDAVDAGPGDTVVVSGAAGGVGILTVQLLRRRGARVVGLASEAHHDLLRRFGAEPLDYRGDDLADRIRALAGDRVTALLDTHGGGYVDLGVALGVPRERIVTIIDFAAAERHGTPTTGQAASQSADHLAELAVLVAERDLVVPVHARYPLDRVRDAYRELAERHAGGKIVLNLLAP
jgi:NADPH:quinone reductase-like Zn-dependent oxidoreductase